MKEPSAALVTRYLSSSSRPIASASLTDQLSMCHHEPRGSSASNSTALNLKAPVNNAAQSKLVAALDALALNDHGSEGEPKSKQTRVEMTRRWRFAVGSVPVKPEKISSKETRKANSNVQGSAESTYGVGAEVANHALPSSTSLGSKAETRTMEQVPVSTNGLGGTTDLPQTSDASSKPNPVPDANATHPLYSYKDYTPKSTVVYTRHEEEANDLVAALESGPLGFDLEWRVLWARRANGQSARPNERRTAIVQLADMTGLILVVQIYGMSRFPKKLQELIENPNVPKLGVNILNDGNKLLNDYGILAKNLVELGKLVHLADPAASHALTSTRTKYRNIISLAKVCVHR
ncbi:hypothetical protein AX15_005558 [Amanita polypyramis BW_CC]|nr:hypothetical protein AX15_005558 [Amanita polypyramis BW_CC]